MLSPIKLYGLILKLLIGVEPTLTGLQPAALPLGYSSISPDVRVELTLTVPQTAVLTVILIWTQTRYLFYVLYQLSYSPHTGEEIGIEPMTACSTSKIIIAESIFSRG